MRPNTYNPVLAPSRKYLQSQSSSSSTRDSAPKLNQDLLNKLAASHESGSDTVSNRIEEYSIRRQNLYDTTPSSSKKRSKDLNTILRTSEKQLSIDREKDSLSSKLQLQKHNFETKLREINREIDRLGQISKDASIEIQSNERLIELMKEKAEILESQGDRLEDLVKKAESLLITMDHFYSEMTHIVPNTSLLPPAVLKIMKSISSHKSNHHSTLVSLRNFYEKVFYELENIENKIEIVNKNVENLGLDYDPNNEELQDSLEEM